MKNALISAIILLIGGGAAAASAEPCVSSYIQAERMIKSALHEPWIAGWWKSDSPDAYTLQLVNRDGMIGVNVRGVGGPYSGSVCSHGANSVVLSVMGHDVTIFRTRGILAATFDGKTAEIHHTN